MIPYLLQTPFLCGYFDICNYVRAYESYSYSYRELLVSARWWDPYEQKTLCGDVPWYGADLRLEISYVRDFRLQ